MASAASSSSINVQKGEQQLRNAANLGVQKKSKQAYLAQAKDALTVAYFHAVKKPQFVDFLNGKILPEMPAGQYVIVPGIWVLNLETLQFQVKDVYGARFTLFIKTKNGLKVEYIAPRADNRGVFIAPTREYFNLSRKKFGWEVDPRYTVAQTD